VCTMPIEQIKVGLDNFSYIIYCPIRRKAAIVDPGYDASKARAFIAAHKLELQYIILTHYHGDHVGESHRVKNSFPAAKVVTSKADKANVGMDVDIVVSDGDHIELGDVPLTFLVTPGHTPGGICILVDNEALVTGDTLFIGDCGRTDLPGGDLVQMYRTLHKKIMTLPDHLVVYPGHDYGDKPFDTLGNQKQTNKTLCAKTLDEFSHIP